MQRSFCKQIDFELNNGEIVFKNLFFPLINTLTSCDFIVQSTLQESYQKIKLHFNYLIDDWISELGNGTEAQKTALAILEYYKRDNKNHDMVDLVKKSRRNMWDSFKESSSLESGDTLNLENKEIKDLSPILSLKKLKYLSLKNNMIESIPELIFELNNLKVIDLSYNNLNLMPDLLLRLRSIEYVDVSYNKISFVPDYILKSQKFNKVFHGLLTNVNSYGDPIMLDRSIYFTPISSEKKEVRYILYNILNEKSKVERRKRIDALKIFGKYSVPLIPFDIEMVENLNLSAKINSFYIWEHKKCKQLFLKSYSKKKGILYEYLGNYFDLISKTPYLCFHEDEKPVKYKLKVLQNNLANLNLKDAEIILKENILFLKSIWGDIFPNEAFQQNLLDELNLHAYATYGPSYPQYIIRCQENICSLYLEIQGKETILSVKNY
ncbi:leucine-rich repeat domain-containing protein [Fluviispira vulneris]|uniref:leucine-rich repeat domain-containing protein n=1 Tax=Fluviispira vulneris TaxID=2763012 RepID=UPI0016451932|nr:leucine-rich repeat domain-containing protein [Fluviispira vulneris]